MHFEFRRRRQRRPNLLRHSSDQSTLCLANHCKEAEKVSGEISPTLTSAASCESHKAMHFVASHGTILSTAAAHVTRAAIFHCSRQRTYRYFAVCGAPICKRPASNKRTTENNSRKLSIISISQGQQCHLNCSDSFGKIQPFHDALCAFLTHFDSTSTISVLSHFNDTLLGHFGLSSGVFFAKKNMYCGENVLFASFQVQT